MGVLGLEHIHEVASVGAPEIFRELVVALRETPPPDALDICRKAVYSLACHGHVHLFEVLLEEHQHPPIPDSALSVAAKRGHIAMLERLVDFVGAEFVPQKVTAKLLEMAEPPMASLECMHARGALKPDVWDFACVSRDGKVAVLEFLWNNMRERFTPRVRRLVWWHAAFHGILDVLHWAADKMPEGLVGDRFPACHDLLWERFPAYHVRTLDFMWERVPAFRSSLNGRKFVNELHDDTDPLNVQKVRWIVDHFGPDVIRGRGDHRLLKKLATRVHEHDDGHARNLAQFVIDEVYDDALRASARQCEAIANAGFFRETRQSTRKRPREH
jgi:hypothetical protein